LTGARGKGRAGVRPLRLSGGSARRRTALLGLLGATLGALLWMGAPLAVGKGSHGTPADRAATRAYLEARLAYARAVLASAPVSLAAVRALQGRLEGECAGVLSGVPRASNPTRTGSKQRTARERGEQKRRQFQAGALDAELRRALAATDLAPTTEAALAYIRAVRPLRWSEPARTTLTQLAATELELELGGSVPPLCADMRAWVASGYRAISATTKLAVSSEEEVFARLRGALGSSGNVREPASLSSFEGPRERRLSRALTAIETVIAKREVALTSAVNRIEVVLGLKTQAETDELEFPRHGSVEIGHGRTLAGTRFKAYVEPPRTRASPLGASGCKHPVHVYAEPAEGSQEAGTVIAITGSSGCLSPAHAGVECEEGVITVELRTVAAARRVRLTLSNGRQVSSRVSPIPRRLGGPAGLYYQALRGPSPTPVRVEELDTRGRVLRTIALPHEPATCPMKKSQEPRRRSRTLAKGSLPGGATFAIRGTLTSHEGNSSFGLQAEHVSGRLGSFGSSSSSGSGEIGGPRHAPPPFAVQLENGCQPAEFAIVYGLLNAPGDEVLARTASGLVTLRHVSIPPGLHAHGVLAYAALPGIPEEVLVRDPGGRTVFTEHLAAEAQEARETCEGEAES